MTWRRAGGAETVGGWDPFVVLGLGHNLGVTGGQVRARLRRVRPDGEGGGAREVAGVVAAFAALRAAERRAGVLADLALDPDRWRGGDTPVMAGLARGRLPAVPAGAGPDEIAWMWDLGGLERAAAARLERAAGVPAWPRTRRAGCGCGCGTGSRGGWR